MKAPPPRGPRTGGTRPSHGLARVLVRLGHCSRSEAMRLIASGRVTLDGRVVRDPAHPVPGGDGAGRVAVDGRLTEVVPRVYLMLNKPRGLVTTADDEQGRDTIYQCLRGADLPWVGPVGRLDRASEGLLLLSNDGAWAARLLDPASHVPRHYHVQIDAHPEAGLPEALVAGREVDGEWLRCGRVGVLRTGTRNAWLDIELTEGRNRHLRRLLAALGLGVLRLVRVGIGPLVLGPLPRGAWRALDSGEVAALAAAGRHPDDRGPEPNLGG